MHWLFKLAITVLGNILGLYAAVRFVEGVSISGDWISYLEIALILTVLNFILKPIARIIFTPIIILTLGLGLIVVNALVLYALDFLSANLTIAGTLPLIYAALVIGFVNIFVNVVTGNHA